MTEKKPNILFILTDQQSANMMNCAGNPYLKTPNMDYLAKHGVCFTNAYCTNPICVPSRFSLMTGLYPSAINFKGNNAENEISEIPQYIFDNGLGKLLNAGGYEAVYGGKEHLPLTNASELGFDYFCSDERDMLADACSEFIKREHKKPFAMVASFINPHDICLMAISDFAENGGGEFARRIAKQQILETKTMREAALLPEGMHPDIFFKCVCPPLPDNYEIPEGEAEAVTMVLTAKNFKKMARDNYTNDKWRIHRWAYAKLTEMVDMQIGKVLSAVIEAGLWDDTVIIFTSDHGDMDASHRMEHKTVLYEECCKIPMIIKGLSGKTGVYNNLVSNGLDSICTILDYAGVTKPDYLPGVSLKSAAEDGVSAGTRSTLIVESEFGFAALDGRYKYVQYSCGKNNKQFYDLNENCGEMYNQLGQARYATWENRLRKAVNEHKYMQILNQEGGF